MVDFLRVALSRAPIASKMEPMPWPVTHILVAEKVFDRYFPHLNRSVFIVGTSFPDIRYPARIDRDLTHFLPYPISEIQAQDSFRAGMLFHSLVDAVWNEYIRSMGEGLFSIVPHSRAMFHAMKVLQDQFLYPLSDRWLQTVAMFAEIQPEESAFSVPPEMVKQWHGVLISYLQKPPEKADLKMLDATLPADLVAAIVEAYLAYEEDLVLREILTVFYPSINELLIPYE